MPKLSAIFKNQNQLLLIVLTFWFLINLLQAYFTGLIDDEALYWFYGQRLRWGYFEQAPFAGWMVRAGYSIFPNEMGVRLASALFSVLSIYFISKIAEVKNTCLFLALTAGIFIIHAGGFIASPDIPVFFFIVLFLLAYKKYLNNPTWPIILLWGFTMAGIMYSKYNGLLFILFVVFSNLKLLKRASFYYAVIFGIFLFTPHLYWLITHDFQTFDFTLFENKALYFDPWLSLKDYLLTVFVIYGPFISVFLIFRTFTYHSSNDFDRALKYSAIGILLFFLLYNFRGRVEGNWAAPAIIPMLILTYRSLEQQFKWHRWVYLLSISTLVLIFVLRIFIIDNFYEFPKRIPNLTHLSLYDDWAAKAQSIAEDSPVVFINSYQRACKYQYYTGNASMCLDTYRYRKTQFFYWKDIERHLQGQKVFVFDFSKNPWIPNRTCYEGPIYMKNCYTVIENYRSYFRVPVDIDFPAKTYSANETIPVHIRINNPDTIPLRFDQHPDMKSFMVFHTHQGKKFVEENKKLFNLSHLSITQHFDTIVNIKAPSEPGKYQFTVSIKTAWLPAAKNSRYHALKVK